jgi:hypothetical protein
MRLYITIIALVLNGCASTETTVVNQKVNHPQKRVTPKVQAHSINSIITNSALKSYKNKYVNAKSHKAFAQSKSGAAYWKSDRTSKKHAMESALVSCQVHNKKFESMYPCRIINVDGVWVTQ